jgi:hypothetical protein
VSIPATCARRQIPFTVKFHRKGLLPTCGCFPDVSKICMLQSYHQNTEQFEILFNKTKYDGAAGKDEGDHRQRGRCRKRGHVLWGVLVFVNLLAASLSPPVAMSAFCLKGVSPPHVTRSSPA